MKERITNLLEKGIDEGYFSGAVWAVYKDGAIQQKGAIGYSSLIPETVEMSEDAIFDLASLTKPLITAPLILFTLREGFFDLETPLVETGLIPVPQNIGIANVFQLLTHTSGIKAWYPLYADESQMLRGTAIIGPDGKVLFEKVPKIIDQYVMTISNSPLESQPGERVIYSCLGYVLLAFLFQKKMKTDFKMGAKNMIIDPLGLERTFFDVPPEMIPETSASEDSNKTERVKVESLGLNFDRWRKGIIHGQVNDCNAYYAQSTTGNAGLFASAEDTIMIAKQFLADSALFEKEELALFYENYTAYLDDHRSIGWRLGSDERNPAYQILPDESLYHSGYTGTAIWINPLDGEIYLLFLNRLHPKWVDFPIHDMRREFLEIASIF